ncbi:MAG: prephenate dehydrogenase/arogenate dehydrogenase family protein [Planctomycetaceae bacterium]|jgi:prephenate dehydrogenase|nr:prephenate dehydrogenase/arogenate dehydrogenase family protein [Planctomycetaceae bacterium]
MTLFSRIVIIGVGLMGGSVGLAAKKKEVAGCIVGVDRDETHLTAARDRGIIDIGTTDFEEGVCRLGGTQSRVAELIVVATPVGLVAEYVQRAAEAIRSVAPPRGFPPRNVLITDVGSTKSAVCSQLCSRKDFGGSRFIGSHPIAGSERSGPQHASEVLFENRLTVISPSAAARDVDIGLLVQFWQRLGSSVICTTPEEHDSILARTSHLPHLLSAILAGGLRSQDIRYTGTGFRSTTRLAAGLPAVWRDIVSSNSGAILEAVRDYEHRLRDLREIIERKDWDGLTAFLEDAKQNRDALG